MLSVSGILTKAKFSTKQESLGNSISLAFGRAIALPTLEITTSYSDPHRPGFNKKWTDRCFYNPEFSKYVTGRKERKNDKKKVDITLEIGPDPLNSITEELFWQYLPSIQLDQLRKTTFVATDGNAYIDFPLNSSTVASSGMTASGGMMGPSGMMSSSGMMGSSGMTGSSEIASNAESSSGSEIDSRPRIDIVKPLGEVTAGFNKKDYERR